MGRRYESEPIIKRQPTLADKLRRADGSAELEALRAENEALKQQLAERQKFKDWTHAYLDAHGVPHHPPGEHGACGCRIGDRMDWLMAKLARAEEINSTCDWARQLVEMEAKLAASEAFSEGWRDENLRLNAAREREMSETIAKLAESEAAAAAMRSVFDAAIRRHWEKEQFWRQRSNSADSLEDRYADYEKCCALAIEDVRYGALSTDAGKPLLEVVEAAKRLRNEAANFTDDACHGKLMDAVDDFDAKLKAAGL